MNITETISRSTWTEWKRKRKLTLIGYVIVGAIVGVDYSVVLATLYLYLENVIKTDQAEIYYGLIIGTFCISSTIFGLLAGRWVDKTRNVRTYLNIIFIMQIIGSLIYAIPYSVAFPLIGRFFVGIGDPFVNVCSGEVIRTYDNEGGTRALWWLASTYSVGFVVGPAVGLVFKGINFHIGSMPVTYLNFVGIFMAVLLVVALIIINILVHDCSKEIDLKKYLKHHHYTPDDLEWPNGEETSFANEPTETTELITSKRRVLHDINDASIPWQQVIIKLSTNIDTVLMFISTFVFMYCLFSSDVLLPLICVVTFQWDITALTYIFVAYGFGYFFILMVMCRFCNSTVGVYYATLLCTLSQVIHFHFFLPSAFCREMTIEMLSCLPSFYLLGFLYGALRKFYCGVWFPKWYLQRYRVLQKH